MSLEIKTYEQTSWNGITRTIYTATINRTTYHAHSIESLNNFINNHVDTREGTF
jgi:hypothetical protein